MVTTLNYRLIKAALGLILLVGFIPTISYAIQDSVIRPTNTTATRLTSTDASKKLVSSDAADWIDGDTENVVTDDGDGTVSLSVGPLTDRIINLDGGSTPPATCTRDDTFHDRDDFKFCICTTTNNWDCASIVKAYGSLYVHEGAVNIDISTVGQGVYVKITGWTTGQTKNVTINSDAFNVDVVGVYKIDYQLSGDSQGTNKDYEVDIFVNGVEQDDGSARRAFGAIGSLGSMSGTAILDITDTTHDIDLRIKETGAGAGSDIDFFNMNFNISLVD